MKNFNEKFKILIVGAYPKGPANRVKGGQLTACSELLNTKFMQSNSIKTIDTTQKSLPPPSLLIRAISALSRLFLLSYQLLANRPDCVIVFLADGLSAIEKGLMVLLAKIAYVPVMVFPRAGRLIDQVNGSKPFSAFVKCTLGKADFFLCQGKSFQTFAIQVMSFPISRTTVIPNWTAKPDLLAIGETKIGRNVQGPKNIVFLGWVEKTKGIFELLEAVKTLKAENLNFTVTIAGEGSASYRVNSLINDLGLSHTVKLLGWVDDEEKKELLKTADIFVLPSWQEGFPNAMVEAMSARVACIVSDVGMISDYAIDGKNAELVQPKDFMALSGKIRCLLLNDGHREAIANEGFMLAKHEFTLEQASAKLYKAVNAILL